MIFVAL